MINWLWSSACKKCRDGTRGGNSKALLCRESDLAKSLFSAILICIWGPVPSRASWVLSVDLSCFGSCWAPRGSGRIPQLGCGHFRLGSLGNKADTSGLSFASPLKRTEKFQALGHCSRIPSGFLIPRQPPAHIISSASFCCWALHCQWINGMFFCSGLLGVSNLLEFLSR